MFRPMLLGSTGLAVVLSSAALAMPQVPIIPIDTIPGQTYVTIDGQWSGVPKDDFTYLETCPFSGKHTFESANITGGYCDKGSKTTPFLNASHQFDSFGGGGVLGFTMTKPWWGDRQRFEVGVAFLTGNRSDSRSDSIDGDHNLLLVPIDGVGNEGCGGLSKLSVACDESHTPIYGNNYVDVTAHAHTSYDAFNIVERILFDFDVTPSFTITPNVGLVFRHSRNSVHATASWLDSRPSREQIGGSAVSERNELVSTREFGLELGATTSFDVTEALKLFGGVNAEFVRRSGEFDGNDCLRRGYRGIDTATASPSCAEASLNYVGVAGFNARAVDRQTDTAVNVTLSLGASYSFPGGTKLSLIGYAQNESHLVVVNPSYPASGEPVAPAHLDSQRDWTPGAVIALTVPFGGS